MVIEKRIGVAIFSCMLICFGDGARAACPTFHTLTNGASADATQVMDNFNSILSCPSFAGNVAIASTGAPELLSMNSSGKQSSNILQGSYTYLGSDYSGWTTILGSNVRARHGANRGMELGSSYTLDGASAIDLKFNTIEFDTAAPGDIAGYTDGTPYSFPKMVIVGNGYVGIGTTSPGYLLDVRGTIFASGVAGALSDVRHKKDIVALKDGALAIVMNLRPVTFQWKHPTDSGMRGEQIGFIAQQVEKVLPSVVLTKNDAEKTKGLKYMEIVPVLTKAIQEQQREIAFLKDANNKEVRSLQSLQAQLAALRHKENVQTTSK